MCGIAGIAALNGHRAVDGLPLTSMLACVRHRGPDDQGQHIEHSVALGHRRLSVIDIKGGHQPLYGQRETTVAVINGEIYNYRELARELRAAGSRFRTASDSEVAAHAYDVWGLDFLDRLDGMFALAVWDGECRRLVLARDRIGEKPLFYATVDGLLLFGSELSAILAHPAVARDIDAAALREYLILEYVPAPHCLVRGVHKLEPGTALVLEHGATRVMRYWTLNPQPSDDPPAYHDAVMELRRRLEDSVSLRLVSDVPLGIFLSGGIDSSTVAALAARHGALDTFSIGFEEASFDESAHARAVAAHIGA
ncbi:MAG: asparagine synthase (glutamine-hydrolyzing), partial [Longimicrobiales bacterium]